MGTAGGMDTGQGGSLTLLRLTGEHEGSVLGVMGQRWGRSAHLLMWGACGPHTEGPPVWSRREGVPRKAWLFAESITGGKEGRLGSEVKGSGPSARLLWLPRRPRWVDARVETDLPGAAPLLLRWAASRRPRGLRLADSTRHPGLLHAPQRPGPCSHLLLFSPQDDGAIRVWKNFADLEKNPEMVTAWQGLSDMLPTTRGGSSLGAPPPHPPALPGAQTVSQRAAAARGW